MEGWIQKGCPGRAGLVVEKMGRIESTPLRAGPKVVAVATLDPFSMSFEDLSDQSLGCE
jgi:hypothetical protein